jgi:hypothetical protein
MTAPSRGDERILVSIRARVSTEQEDLAAQRYGLHALGVGDRIFVDHGLTGTSPFWWLGLFFVLIVVG